MRFVILLVALLSSCQGRSQDPPSCCRLEITTSVDQPTELHVVVTNLKDAPVSAFRWLAPELNLRVNIDGENGNVPVLTKHGELIRSGRPLNGSLQQTAVLHPGDKLTEVFDLRRLYTFKTGRYVVTVFRDVSIGDKKIELQGKTTILVPSGVVGSPDYFGGGPQLKK
jgi:hypothetical protein